MLTTRVPAFRCGTDWPGWLVGTDPTMEDDEVYRTVCFNNRDNGCKYSEKYEYKNKTKQKTKTNKQTNKQPKNRKRKEAA